MAEEMVAQPLLPSDPETVGRYRLDARLGVGGTGRVYLARSASGKRVALRVINQALLASDDARWRLAGEVRALYRVTGPRAARLDNADLHGDPPWLATEYVPGRTLGEHVLREGPLDAPLTAALGVMLADALSELHEAGSLHRDLKPRNVILGPDGPKAVDAGLAVLAEPFGPAYRAPEQVAGRDDTTAADVYALGATLVYAASGHILYPDRAASALLAAIVDPYNPPNLSGVPEELVKALAAMIAVDPDARPSVDDLRRRLVRLAGGQEAVDDLTLRLVQEGYAHPANPESDGSDPDDLDSDGLGPDGDVDAAGDDEPAPFDPETTRDIGPPVDPPSHHSIPRATT
ncbi:serine/threonine-protein kinase [Pseudofrankia sp. BMG5.37]|uniref:serine/threonine-protein kinase n=1 Tax=Pseudofrankia sp. BMG5.37 TaxID=3050035 RepID=UPI002895FFAD|nr:serine/threonine-protein kinase [Pseudofrankia sp. BMG5.37]MDT3445029.1 serine/threonine-protein kinase [Pseudofrankia sp. BMG5.37]